MSIRERFFGRKGVLDLLSVQKLKAAPRDAIHIIAKTGALRMSYQLIESLIAIFL